MNIKKRKRLLLCSSIALVVLTGLTAGRGVQLSATALATPATQTITVTLFGPQQFARSTGQPKSVTQSFSIPPSVHAPFYLVVDNGDAAGNKRVSSAHIVLNGTEVAGPSDFGQQVAHLDREVTADASNTLTVQLEGKPGSFLTVSLTGASDTAGALGGLITVTDPASPIDGATVQIPAGALTQETSVVLAPFPAGDLQTAIGQTLPSSMRLRAGSPSTPEGLPSRNPLRSACRTRSVWAQVTSCWSAGSTRLSPPPPT